MNRRLFLTALLLCVPALAQTTENPPVRVGQKVTFTATADGTEPISFVWYKDGVQIFSGNPYVIPSAAPTDAGVYKVTASNIAGSADSQLLTVVVIYGDGPPPAGTPANATIQRIVD